VERRTSRAFNTVEVDPVLVEEILRLHLEERSGCRSFFSAFVPLDSISRFLARHYIDYTKEKAGARLAVTYGILRRLGFSEDWVEQCLRTMSGIELDEALDWVSPDIKLCYALSCSRAISLLSIALITHSK
jgi:ATP-dependent RNA helicase DHX29